MENVEENIFDLLVSDVPKLHVMQKQEQFHAFREEVDKVFEGFIGDFYSLSEKPVLPEINESIECVRKHE